MSTVGDIQGDYYGRLIIMTKEDKENLKNRRLTESLLISCLATCESVISKNAYLEKKWSNYCGNRDYGGYYAARMEWTRYREKLHSLLLPIYPMKMIIQLTKGCKDKATQKIVKEVIELVENNDYELV